MSVGKRFRFEGTSAFARRDGPPVVKALTFILAAALLALLGIRLHDIGFRLGDLVAWWVLAVTLGLEALIVIGGAIEWKNDPRVQEIARKRSLLDMAKHDKAVGRRVQERAL